jgi:hypothetical protein
MVSLQMLRSHLGYFQFKLWCIQQSRCIGTTSFMTQRRRRRSNRHHHQQHNTTTTSTPASAILALSVSDASAIADAFLSNCNIFKTKTVLELKYEGALPDRRWPPDCLPGCHLH